MNRCPFVAILLLVHVVGGGTAYGDTATEASFHFKRGMELVQSGNLEGALGAFFQSNRLSPNPSVVHNIGLCLELMGHHDEAFSYFAEFDDMAVDKLDIQDAKEALKRVLPTVARLEVITTPPGATIYVDRKNLGEFGRSPRIFAAPPGEHTVLVELAGYRPGQAKVTLAKGKQASATMKLVRIVGSATVTSNPPGATLTSADGEEMGKTPVTVDLPPGQHELRLTLAGHRPGTATVDMVADKGTRAMVKLDPLPPPTGRVTVTANYPGALLKLDGKESGFTPAVLDDVVVGEHTLVVGREGFRPWEGKVMVEESTPLWATVTLEPKHQETGRGPWPAVIALTAGAAVVAGGIFGSLALFTHEDFEHDPSREVLENGERLNLAADALFATGGILGAASAALFLLTEPKVERPSTAHVTGMVAPQ